MCTELPLRPLAAALLGVLGASCGSQSMATTAAAPRDRAIIALKDWSIVRCAIAPTGRMVADAFNKRTLAEQIILVSGAGATPVTPPDIHPGAFAWLPDSTQVIVASMPSASSPTPLQIYSLSGRLERTIQINIPVSVDSGMTVLPGGTAVVVAAEAPGLAAHAADLYEVDLATGRARQLTKTPQVSEQTPSAISGAIVAFSTDIVPMVHGSPQTPWVGVIDLRSLVSRRLTNVAGQGAGEESVAPDGRYVIYFAVPSDSHPQHYGLWVVPVSGGAPVRVVADDYGSNPAVTPSGLGVWSTVTGPNSPYGTLVFRTLPFRL